MPTYQYACKDTDCGNQFELVQSFVDPSASECPVCGGPVRKVYGSVGVTFKGSGFYRTDSRADSSSSVSTSSPSESSSPSPAAPSTSGGSSSAAAAAPAS